MNGVGSTSQTQSLISTANNTNSSAEERAQAVSALNDNSFQGFQTMDDAAESFGRAYNGESVDLDIEIGAMINKVSLSNGDNTAVEGTDSDGTVSILSPALRGETKVVDGVKQRELNTDNIKGVTINFLGSSIETKLPGVKSGFVHTHGRGDLNMSSYNLFGGGDRGISKSQKITVYMANRNGRLTRFNYHAGGGEERVGFIRLPTTRTKAQRERQK